MSPEQHELDRHLRFRDRLRADPTLACEYAALKRRLAGRFANDREAYTEAKRQFIQTNCVVRCHALRDRHEHLF